MARPGLDEAALRRGLRVSVCAFAFAVALSITAANVAWPFTALFLLLLARTRGIRPRWSPILLPVGVYCAVTAAAAVAAIEPSRSLHAVWSEVNKLFLLFVLGWAFAVEPTPEALAWMGGGFLASALLGIVQSVAFRLYARFGPPPGDWSSNIRWYLPYLRAHGTLHPVTYGEQMVFAFLAGLSALLLPPRADGFSAPRRRIAAFTAVIALALILSQTRGAWIAAVAGVAALAWLRPSGLRKALGPTAILAALLFAPVHPVGRALWARASSAVEPSHASNAGRIELWKTAAAMAADHPVLGVGPNNFRSSFHAYHPEPLDGSITWGDAHNQFLDSLAERGSAGLAALLILFGAFIVIAERAFRESPNALSLWAVSSAVALPVMCLTETAFQSSMAWMPFLFIWAFGEATRPRRGR